MESRILATTRRRPRRTSVDAINNASSSRQINTPQPQLTNTFVATPQKRPYDVIDLTNDDDEKDQENNFIENKTLVTSALSSFNDSAMTVIHTEPTPTSMLVTVPSDEESGDDSSDEEQENIELQPSRLQPVAPVRLRNTEPARPPIAAGLCEICRENYTRLEYGSDLCPDAFCVECWHTYLSMKLKEHKFPCRCPAPRCRSVVNPDNASRLFRLQPTNPIASTSLENTVNVLGSKSEIEILIQKFKRLHDEAIMQNKIYCPVRTCSRALQYDPKVARSNLERGHWICANCMVPYHHGLACRGFQDIERAKGSANTLEEQQTLTAIRNQKMQKCPNCGFWSSEIRNFVLENSNMSTDIAAPAPAVIATTNAEHHEATVAEQKQTTSGLKSFISGGFGGVAAVLVGHPFDLIKVRLQTAPAGTYTGILDVTKQTIAKDGLRGYVFKNFGVNEGFGEAVYLNMKVRMNRLYRGMGPPLVGVTPVFAVSFWSYDLGKKLVYAVTPNRTSQTLNLGEIMAAGFFSAGPTTLLMGPLERIKVLLQVQGQGGEAKYKGPIDAVRQLYKEGGIRSIFRGSAATFLRDGPGSAAYFGVYELTKRLLTPKGSTPDQLNPGAVLFAGGMAAIPPDVLKSRLQSAPTGTYSGTLDVLRHLLKTDGPGALFKGLGPAMLRAFPANAACFLGVEYSLKAMNYLW
ncbi:14450_t:CDS:10 [Ambispora leptoticha]|uniref:14450_t:CDS:1 n=1 Tax=Ambispora leptoticha TaxID=144679 RepID=A0A9N8ZB17_9GLOM|nr:14450_t:CDS:10 [Ambispora leptoticha]